MEEWKEIKGYPKYHISNCGRVKSVKTNKIMKTRSILGYVAIRFTVDKKVKSFYIHRLVADAFLANPDNLNFVDHIDNIKTNNNASNLRYCTHQQNQFNKPIYKNNTSSVKGVCYDKKRNKWKAFIIIDGKNIYLGRFDTLEEAKQVRQTKAKELFGVFVNNCEK